MRITVAALAIANGPSEGLFTAGSRVRSPLPSGRRWGACEKQDYDSFRSLAAMVYLRNVFSHPTDQYIRKGHEAIEQLAYIAKLLNRLFK